MGQYFKFINVTKDEESQVPLPFNFGLPWAKNLDQVSQKELEEYFEFVVKNNHWSESDTVTAYGDYGSVVNDPREPAVKAGRSLPAESPAIRLKDHSSCVKLEMDVETLEIILQSLLERQRKDLLEGFIVQLWAEEFITKEEVARLASHYEIDPITVP